MVPGSHPLDVSTMSWTVLSTLDTRLPSEPRNETSLDQFIPPSETKGLGETRDPIPSPFYSTQDIFSR